MTAAPAAAPLTEEERTRLLAAGPRTPLEENLLDLEWPPRWRWYMLGYYSGRRSGHTAGYEQGFTDGHEAGYQAGYEPGFIAGHDDVYLYYVDFIASAQSLAGRAAREPKYAELRRKRSEYTEPPLSAQQVRGQALQSWGVTEQAAEETLAAVAAADAAARTRAAEDTPRPPRKVA